MVFSRSSILLVDSRYFVEGNANTGNHPFGKGLIVDGGEQKALIRWHFNLKRSGHYFFGCTYASRDPRPVNVKVDEEYFFSDCLGSPTGGWTIRDMKSVVLGDMFLQKGHHELLLTSPSFIPHIRHFFFSMNELEEGRFTLSYRDRFFQWLYLPPFELPRAGVIRKFFHYLVTSGWKKSLKKTVSFLSLQRFMRGDSLRLMGMLSKERAWIGPKLVQVDMTFDCNNQCIGCWCHSPLLEEKKMSMERKKTYLKKDRLFNVLKELKGLGTDEIYFAGGGEPSCHPDFIKIIEFSKKMGFVVYLNTNFTLFSNDLVDTILKLGLDHFTISVWAGDAKTYMATHPGRGEEDFARLERAVRYLCANKKGKPYVKIYHVLNSYNFESFEQMLDWTWDVGADSVEFTLTDTIPGKTDSLLLSEKALKDLYQKALAICSKFPNGYYKDKIFLYNWDDFLRRLSDGEESSKGNIDTNIVQDVPCSIGWSFSRINADGQVNACLKSHRIPLGNINDENFESIWFSDHYNEFRKKTFMMDPRDPFFKDIGNDPLSEFGCRKSCDDIGRNRHYASMVSSLGFLRKCFLRLIEWAFLKGFFKKQRLSFKSTLAKNDFPQEVISFAKNQPLTSGPREVVVDITNACSGQCLTCFTRSPLLNSGEVPSSFYSESLSLNRVSSLLDEFKLLAVQRIRLSGGGDPLCHKDIVSICERANENGQYLSVTTSLLGVKHNTLKRILDCGVTEVNVSLNGWDKASWAAFHSDRREEEFELILDHLREIGSHKNVKLSVSFVVYNKNLKFLLDMATLAKEYKVHEFSFLWIDPLGGKLSSLSPSSEDKILFQSSLSSIERAFKSSQVDFPANWEAFKEQGLLMMKGRSEFSQSTIEPCSVPWHFARVLAGGDVVPCCKGVEYSMGNLRDYSFSEIWFSEKFQAFRKNNRRLKDRLSHYPLLPCQSGCDNVSQNMAFLNEALYFKQYLK